MLLVSFERSFSKRNSVKATHTGLADGHRSGLMLLMTVLVKNKDFRRLEGGKTEYTNREEYLKVKRKPKKAANQAKC